MPWRQDTRPYYVLVSELMLQQTQVGRVIPKFEAFIDAFPDEKTLAASDLADVLVHWQGLGYNRRAKFLHDGAKRIIDEFDGQFPTQRSDILSLPGVGPNTAGAIEAYAFNRPSVFIETNIRTVYIHHCFDDQEAIDDHAIRRVLTETIDHEHPREFYWSLMDYGTWLKANGVRNVRRSKHYRKQAPLEGSVRQVRGKIVAVLGAGPQKEPELRAVMPPDDRFDTALAGLLRDGLVMRTGSLIHLTK